MMKAAQPAAVGRRERRQQETRERLFQSAMRLLSERDFSEVTIEMITEAADVGKGTFFNYFPNKEAIVSYRFEQQFQVLSELLGQGEDRETKRQRSKEKQTQQRATQTTNYEPRATNHEPRTTNRLSGSVFSAPCTMWGTATRIPSGWRGTCSRWAWSMTPCARPI